MLKKVAVLAVVLLLAFGVMMLTTRNTTFVVEESLALATDAEQVWTVLSDVDAWPQWWPGIVVAKLRPGWQQGAVLELTLKGSPEKTPATVQIVSPSKQLAWVRAGVLGSSTSTILRITATDSGSTVSLKNAVRGPQAFLARFTGKEAFAKYQALVLQALKVQLQNPAAGEPGAGAGGE